MDKFKVHLKFLIVETQFPSNTTLKAEFNEEILYLKNETHVYIIPKYVIGHARNVHVKMLFLIYI